MPSVTASRAAVPSLVLAAAAWGLGTVLSKRAVAELAPLVLLAIQLASSLAVVAVVRGITRRRPAGPVPARLAWLGVLNPGIAYGLSLVGLTQITASLSVLLWALEPILILALAAVVLGERMGRTAIALSLLALAGMLMVVLEPGASGTPAGIAITVAGVACCAVYTVLSRRWLVPAHAVLDVVLAQQATALLFALAAVLVVVAAGAPILDGAPSAAAVASAVVSGVVYYGAAYWLYLRGLRLVPASVAAMSFYLIPVFGVAGGVVALGEGLELTQWVGATVVVAAVAFLLRRDPRRGRSVTAPRRPTG